MVQSKAGRLVCAISLQQFLGTTKQFADGMCTDLQQLVRTLAYAAEQMQESSNRRRINWTTPRRMNQQTVDGFR